MSVVQRRNISTDDSVVVRNSDGSVNEAMTDKAMKNEQQRFEDVTNFVMKAEESKMAHSLKGG